MNFAKKQMPFFSIIFCSLLMTSQAMAELVRVNVDLAGTYSLPSGEPSPTGKFGFAGGGLVLDFPFARDVEFEVSGAYLTSKYSTGGTAFTNTKADLTAGLRFDVSKSVSINAGIFYDVLFKNPQNFSGTLWGFVGGASLQIPTRKGLDIILSGQYHYAPNTIDYALGTIQPSEIVLLAGFRFSKSTN